MKERPLLSVLTKEEANNLISLRKSLEGSYFCHISECTCTRHILLVTLLDKNHWTLIHAPVTNNVISSVNFYDSKHKTEDEASMFLAGLKGDSFKDV